MHGQGLPPARRLHPAKLACLFPSGRSQWTGMNQVCQTNLNVLSSSLRSAGWGQWTGMNQALQINYTCGDNVLGMIADVNYNDNYVNVRPRCVALRCAVLVLCCAMLHQA